MLLVVANCDGNNVPVSSPPLAVCLNSHDNIYIGKRPLIAVGTTFVRAGCSQLLELIGDPRCRHAPCRREIDRSIARLVSIGGVSRGRHGRVRAGGDREFFR